MPIYEFQCLKCQSEFELLVRASESSSCPDCQSQQIERQMSSFSAGPSKANSLPVCGPAQMPSGGCGRPQCGSGGCQQG